MARLHVYADESGNFDFSLGPKASKYFILTTVVIQDHRIAGDLLALRRELAWEGVDLRREFHATEDEQAVRDRVFEIIARHDFRVDVTALYKRKTQPHVRRTETRFYKTAWYYHMKHITPRIAGRDDDLLVVAASVGTKKKRQAFFDAVRDVTNQIAPNSRCQTAFWPAAVEPCLQVADYCSWAVQRKWEAGDDRSYVLIQDKINTEFDLFATGTQLYY